MYFDSRTYALRIKELRIEKGLTQEQLAEKIGISINYLAKIETGKQTGTIDLAVDFAMYFDVSLDDLLLGKNEFTGSTKQKLRAVIDYLSSLEDLL